MSITAEPIPTLRRASKYSLNLWAEECSRFLTVRSRVGVPQVVLPQWLDTYDCATRVEWLGIGLNGSRTAAPGAEAKEFSKALLHVLGDEGIRAKSAAVKGLCKGEGRIEAHDRIVEFCMK